MACSARYINYNPVQASIYHQEHWTSWEPTYLLVLLDAIKSDDNDNNELDEYLYLQDYKHSSINIHIQDKTTDNQGISF